MMRGTKDEDKSMSPMFPRVHVNDTEKGGPRAPPRNKMALYEQLSIPSQRFRSESTSTLPNLHNNASCLAPLMSSSHSGYAKNAFIPYRNSSTSSRLAEKPVPQSSAAVKLSPPATQEPKSINATIDENLNTAMLLSSNAKCNSFRANKFSNFKNFSGKKVGDESDFRVPRSSQSGASLNHIIKHQIKNRESQPHTSLSCSAKLENASQEQKKGSGTIDLKVIESRRSQNEEKTKVAQACQDSTEQSSSVPSIKDKTSVGASSSPSGKFKSTESLKRTLASSNLEHKSSSVQKIVHCKTASINQGIGAMRDKTIYREHLLLESQRGKGKENPSNVGGELHPRPSCGIDKNSSLNGLPNGSKCLEDQEGGRENHDVSETSMVDCVDALEITPDDVVGVMGEKEFLKARRAIVNQQRVFAVQVFELHRLIKVQKLIAGSPDVLFQYNLYVGKASLKVAKVKKVPSKFAIEPPPLAVKPKDHCHKLHPSTEFADENAVGKLPLPSVNNETTKLATPRSNYTLHSANVSAAPTATTINKPSSPWCLPPPGNQWLVPVMSPSEGLIYKPFTGPCPPTAGFAAPVYGSCGPMNMTPGSGDFLNAAYGVPASHQGIGILPPTPSFEQNYFPPYVMPVMNPSISGSAVEQISPFTRHRTKDNEFIFPISNQSSCNKSSEISRAFSRYVRASKESEIQGSTASSPAERSKGDALPLFPTEPTAVQPSDQNAEANEQITRVIKVVPHNPRSAPESAARIFRSIQEERKQL